MSALFTYRREIVDLAGALKAFAPGSSGAVALVYTPKWCGFARLVGGELRDGTGAVPRGAYEVRVFDGRSELRWLNDPATSGTGAAVILTEDASLKLPEGWKSVQRTVTDTNAVTYLLWGEHAPASKPLAADWSLLGLARIGALPVPVAGLAPKGRVLLHATEYIAEDEFGSAFVCEERLTVLEVSHAHG